VTLAGLLQKQGYKTIHVGKGHFGPEETDGENPSNLGFDVNIGGASFGAPGSYFGEKNYGKGGKRDRSAVPHLDQYHGTDTFLTEALTIETKKVIAETVKSDEPFFLYFSHYAVHAPFESDPRFADHYKDSGKPANAQAFATLIEGMDKSLGDMLDQFEDLGIGEDTLVFFLGDNGSDAPLGHEHEVACAAPLRGKKGAHYEGGMRVPFIAAWVKANEKNDHQQRLPIVSGTIQKQSAAVYDLFPTILELVSADPIPEGHEIDGSRLNSLLTGKPDTGRKDAFLMHYPHGPHRSNYFTTYREGDWKVIYHYLPGEDSGGARYQLFNLEKDPFEQNDLAEKEPQVLKRMMTTLAEGLTKQSAQYPVDEEGKPLLPQVP